MKNLKNIILLISIATISCGEMETVIDLEIPANDPVLVLNGRLDTDTNIRVLISSSVGAFETTSPSMVNDANIILFENNQLIDTLTIDLNNTINPYINDGNWNTYGSIEMNYYTSNYIPKKDKTYMMEVSHPNYPSISGTTYIPDDIIMNNISIDSTSNNEKINFQFSFNDNGNQENFYSLLLKVSCSKEIYGDDDYSYGGRVEMFSNDPSFPTQGDEILSGYTFSGMKAIFNDALFNGQQKNISIDVFTEDFKYDNCDTVKFIFSTFSDNAYRYYNSLSDHRNNGGLDIFGGEVVPVFTNIDNGLGILISTNKQEVYIKP
jgi:hypothetical protein|tara:strand:+ start:125 stop:1087 length:963 start_codon:yes stop_codon:yes gene_type:complete